MSKLSDKSRFVPEPVLVWLGQKDQLKEYSVVPATWASLFRLKGVLKNLLLEVTGLWNSDILTAAQQAGEGDTEGATNRLKQLVVNDQVWELVQSLLEKPEEIIVLAIPEVDKDLFEKDNKLGITIAQVWETFRVIMEVNRLGEAKKLLSLLNPTPTNQ